MNTTLTSEKLSAENRPTYHRTATPLRGIDHLALVTEDMRATIDFYTRVLKMPLVHVRKAPYAPDRGQPPYDNVRHYFFNMGSDSLLAFFEYPTGLDHSNRDLPGGMQHLAFNMSNQGFDEMVAHVQASGVKVMGPYHLGDRFWSAYFMDNNGIRLELTTTLADEALGAVESVCQTREDVRAELETLYDDRQEVARILDQMPLRDAPVAIQQREQD